MMARNRLAHTHRSTAATKKALRFRRGNLCFSLEWPRVLLAAVITLLLFSLANQTGKEAVGDDNGHNQLNIAPRGDTLESSQQSSYSSSPRKGAGEREDEGAQEAQRGGWKPHEQQNERRRGRKDAAGQDSSRVAIDGRIGSNKPWRGVRGHLSDREKAAERFAREQDEVSAPGAVSSETTGHTPTTGRSVRSTALLVAIDGDVEGMSTLTTWSDFVLATQGRTTKALEEGRKRARECAGTGRQTKENVTSGAREEELEKRKWAKGREKQGKDDQVFSRFPEVWIITSDPGIDRTVRECMPHLLLFFVPGIFGSVIDEDAEKTGGASSWSDVLDRFSSATPDVDVYGLFGEGTLPTAALLPFSLQSFFGLADATGGHVASDAGGGGDCSGGCVIERSLWPVISMSTSPIAVLSRARAWWKEDRADGTQARGVLGEWMPDKFVAQIWCNRAMLATSRRSATGLGEADSIGSGGLSSFLHVIQRLVRRPDEVGAVLVDGTKAAPSRYMSPPVAAANDESTARGDGGVDGVEEGRFHLSRLSRNALERADLERQLEEAKQEHTPQDQSPARAKRPPDAVPSESQPLPEVDFYIGALQLTLGSESHGGLRGENPALVAKSSSGAPPPSVGPSQAGHGKMGNGDGGRPNHEGEISADEGTLVEAQWPPEYILENVQQSPFNQEAAGSGYVSSFPPLPFPGDIGIRSDPAYPNDEQQRGLVVVSSVNCGYLDMAVNFLHSVRRARKDVKVLFVAMDEVAFDFLDAFSPGCTVLLHRKDSEREHAGKAGRYGDEVFKRQTSVRPEILLGIVKQGYRALWTDVDIVWLGNALSVLPVSRKNEKAVEVMVPMDDATIKCTCFMYLDHTPNTIRLLELWKKNIMENNFKHDQDAFRRPLRQMERAGLGLKILPDEVMPAGNKIFNENFLKNNYERYEDKLLIVHNNWVFGHSDKRNRFCEAGLWHVDGKSFPTC